MVNDYSHNSKIAAISLAIEQQLNEVRELLEGNADLTESDRTSLESAKDSLEHADDELGNLYR